MQSLDYFFLPTCVYSLCQSKCALFNVVTELLTE